MKLRFLTVLVGCMLSSLAFAADYKLSRVKELPDGLASDVAKMLDANGFQVSTRGAAIELWFVKDLAVKEGFKPSLSQLYPFQPGQFVGAMRIAKGAEFTDFRNQKMKPGVYTLRFGLQPMDGNHVGTSETSDFLLALPAANDTKTAPISSFDDLSQASAKASGATHPAIYSLLDPAKAASEPKLETAGADHQVLSTTLSGKSNGKTVPVKLRLVVIGHTEG